MLFVNHMRPLTERETQIAGMVALGMSSKEIAYTLSIDVRTVENHLQKIYQKLQLHNRAALAVYAERHGMVPDYPNK